MEHGKQIAAMAEGEEERLRLVRVCDRLERAAERGQPAASAFLSPREQALVKKLLPNCAFWGGTQGAERAVAYYLPDYLGKDDFFDDGVIACLRAGFYEKNALGHRDILGALMGAGLRRDAVGDIYLHENDCEFFVLDELARYLLDNLTSAGRHALRLEQINPRDVQKPPQQIKELRLSVASLRLDSVVSGAFHLSRGAAADAIRAGRAAVNSLPCTKPDRTVAENDEISLRGAGKLRVLRLDGETRRGRTALTVGIYL